MANATPERNRLTFLVKAAELTQRVAVEPLLSRFEISYAQLAMLLSVLRMPGASSAALARIHGITAQSAGEVIAQLVRRKLMKKEASLESRRVQCIYLTAKGQALLAQARPGLVEIERRLTHTISPEDLGVACMVLSAMIANGDAVPPEML